MDIISREEAKARGLKRYFDGTECNKGHVSEKYVNRGSCVECALFRAKKRADDKKEEIADYHRKYREENKEAIALRKRKWCEENEERLSERRKLYYQENKDKINTRNREYQEENKGKIAEYMKEYCSYYYQENKGYYFAKCAQRRAAQIQRTLPGHDSEIREIYIEAVERRANGEDVHVDHIVPLQGKLVSGLHVPWNLEIIPAKENLRKNNAFEPYTEFY